MANKIVQNDPLPAVSLSAGPFARLAVVLIGLILMATALPNLIGDIYSIIQTPSPLASGVRLDSALIKQRATLMTDALRLLIGGIMVVGFKRIAALASKAAEAIKVPGGSGEE
ncbi:MAG: hypothetical protein N2376_02790 [Clostridia bacterium]|nr:hypothetical protein [Clostridia bacterium]